MPSPTRRATPMSPEDRKTAILAVVVPLIAEHGASVTTAEIAKAAGVAEGTLYRVFPDKVTMLIEAVKAAIDPTDITTALGEIDPTASLEQKLTEASKLLVARVSEVTALINAVRSLPHPEPSDHDAAHRFVADAEAAISESLTLLLEPHADQLNVEPSKAAAALRGLLLASAHPLLAHGESLTTNEVIEILTSGILASVIVAEDGQ